MRGALFALRILARKYEFKDEEERGPLAPIVAGFLPPLLQILQVGASHGLGAPGFRCKVKVLKECSAPREALAAGPRALLAAAAVTPAAGQTLSATATLPGPLIRASAQL